MKIPSDMSIQNYRKSYRTIFEKKIGEMVRYQFLGSN